MSLSQVSYAVIGAVAVISHGSTRTTVDIDVTISAELENLQRIPELFSDSYTPAITDPCEFIKRHFFIPLQHNDTKVRVDIAAALI